MTMYEELRGDLAAWATHFHFNDETSLLLCKAADAIEDLSKTLDEEVEINTALECNMPVWIPVTERLPENEEVLCINDYSFYMVGWLHCDDVGNYICESDSENMYDVTHWMPLPEQPKDGEE